MNLKRVAPPCSGGARRGRFCVPARSLPDARSSEYHCALLLVFVESHVFLAAIGFVLAYAAVVALSLPGATIMTLAGGFLFGVPLGATLTVIGATVGATLLFVIARSAFGDLLRQRAGPFLARMAEGFRKDAFSYLLFLRLVPAFPFWAVNLARRCSTCDAPTVPATASGLSRGLVYTAFGASLGQYSTPETMCG